MYMRVYLRSAHAPAHRRGPGGRTGRPAVQAEHTFWCCPTTLSASETRADAGTSLLLALGASQTLGSAGRARGRWVRWGGTGSFPSYGLTGLSTFSSGCRDLRWWHLPRSASKGQWREGVDSHAENLLKVGQGCARHGTAS